MVKKIESYPELADPQLRPRYSGIPTFFRLPHTEQLGEVDIGIIGVTRGMRVVSIEEFNDQGWRWAAEEARKVIGEGPAYVSFDIDSLDPAYAPGTGTPEPGGLTTLEAQRMIRELASLDFIGADLVEVSPPFDPSGITSITAATILFELLCVLTQARVRRRSNVMGPRA